LATVPIGIRSIRGETQARSFVCFDGFFLEVEFHVGILLSPLELRDAALYCIKMLLELGAAHGIFATGPHERSQQMDNMSGYIIGPMEIWEYARVLFCSETIVERLGAKTSDLVLYCPRKLVLIHESLNLWVKSNKLVSVVGFAQFWK
jgi:hypothetical protein